MGVVRGTRAMLKINQAGGIDCPSCAWPDPESHRTFAEFCENGAKAMADEGTTKRIGAEFFASHSIEELSRQTDHWLNDQGRLTEPLVLREGGSNYEPISWEAAFESDRGETKFACVLHTKRSSILRVVRPTKPPFSINYSFVNSAPTTCRTARTCVMNRRASLSSESIGLGKATIRLEDFREDRSS